jgi:hypothetical protein
LRQQTATNAPGWAMSTETRIPVHFLAAAAAIDASGLQIGQADLNLVD